LVLQKKYFPVGHRKVSSTPTKRFWKGGKALKILFTFTLTCIYPPGEASGAHNQRMKGMHAERRMEQGRQMEGVTALQLRKRDGPRGMCQGVQSFLTTQQAIRRAESTNINKIPREYVAKCACIGMLFHRPHCQQMKFMFENGASEKRS
jgi:hypothetical protein